MDISNSYVMDSFFTTRLGIFTADDFIRFLKTQGIKISKENAIDILTSSTMVFSLINEEFVTRAGVFKNRIFTFMPTREEIEKGHIVMGHRCMPFINPDVSPDKINVANSNYIVSSEPTVFSMNFAMDVFALYGEGFIIPYIFNDHANQSVSIKSIQYSMPSEIELTSWPLEKLFPDTKVKYGDRILARVVNWEDNVVELKVIPAGNTDSISASDIEREDWYSSFEEGLLNSMEKNGPLNSIEEQLAYLYLEHQKELCIENCGSIEEFLKHTKKIAFCPYGVETRIWKTGENVPYIGTWNKEYASQAVYSNLSSLFTPEIIDAYLEDAFYKTKDTDKKINIQDIFNSIYTTQIKFTSSEKKLILLNMQKRHDIIEKNYSSFVDYDLYSVRGRILELFTKVNFLMCSIACSSVDFSLMPQQELIIIIQLFNHLIRIIEEMQNSFLRGSFPVDDVLMSLEGMEETYEDISESLFFSLDENTYKNIQIVD